MALTDKQMAKAKQLQKDNPCIGRKALMKALNCTDYAAWSFLNGRCGGTGAKPVVTDADIADSLRVANRETAVKLRSARLALGDIGEAIRVVQASVESEPPVAFPKVVSKRPAHSSRPVTLAVQLTDWHIGLVTPGRMVEGFNEYNWDIAKRRVAKLSDSIRKYTEVLRAGYTVDDCVVLCTGDYCCFPADAEVTMENGGVKRIEDIVPGDKVLGNPDPGVVTEVHPRPMGSDESLLRLKVAGGLDLVATKEHVVACLPREIVETGWNKGGKRAVGFVVRDKNAEASDICERSVGELRPRDYLVTRPYRPTDGSDTLNIADVTGILLRREGDQLFKSPTRGNTPSVVSSDNIKITDDLLWLLGMYIAEGSSAKGRSGAINTAAFTLNVNEDALASKIVKVVGDTFGYAPRVVKNQAHNVQTVYVNNQIIATLLVNLTGGLAGVMSKVVPDVIYRSPRSLLPLVAGWLDGDGGLYRRSQKIVGTTVNPTLARQMANILLSERVECSVKLEPRAARVRRRPVYRIILSGKSGQALSTYCIRFDPSTFSPTYEVGIWAGDCYCLPIMSVNKSEYTGIVYDLTVTPCHRYQVSGYVVHNSGDIHDGLVRSNEFQAPVQAVKAGRLLTAFLRDMASLFPNVRVEFIAPGNHDRLSKKPQAQLGGENSWGYVVGSIAEALLEKQGNLDFNLYPSMQEIVEVAGRRYLIGHGDGILGTWGIPFYGIERKVSRESKARMNMPEHRHFHKIVIGHFHTGLDHPDWFVGGSLSGTDENDHKQGRHMPAHQTSWVVHPEHGEFGFTRWFLD